MLPDHRRYLGPPERRQPPDVTTQPFPGPSPQMAELWNAFLQNPNTFMVPDGMFPATTQQVTGRGWSGLPGRAPALRPRPPVFPPVGPSPQSAIGIPKPPWWGRRVGPPPRFQLPTPRF